MSHIEIGEELLSLAFALFAIDVIYRIFKDRIYAIWTKKKLTSLLLLTVLILTSILTLVKPNKSELRLRLYQAASIHYPKHGLNDQAQKIFQYIIDHEDLKNESNLIAVRYFFNEYEKKWCRSCFIEGFAGAKKTNASETGRAGSKSYSRENS